MTDPLSGQKPPLLEVHQRLDQIVRGHPAARLLVDMARDAANEAAREQAGVLARYRRARRGRSRAKRRAVGLLDALAAAPARLGPAAGPPADALLGFFRALRNDLYPSVTRILHDGAGKGEPRDFQTLLVERVLRSGQRTLTEALLLRPDDDRAALRERLQDHLGGRLVKRLARKAGCRVNLQMGLKLEELLKRSLALLDDLLTTEPAGRLFWPEPGEPFDAARHERGGGKPGSERRVVKAVLFPGLRRFGPTPAVLERALVATKHAEG